MRKIIVFGFILLCAAGLIGCNTKTVEPEYSLKDGRYIIEGLMNNSLLLIFWFRMAGSRLSLIWRYLISLEEKLKETEMK